MSDDRGEQLRTQIEGADRPRTWPNQAPRDAATLIIIDRRGREPKVLMGRRHAGHKFMPGKFVFPGGRLEAGDRRIPSASELRPETASALTQRVVRRSAGRGRALALTAIRETFEETGLLLGCRCETQPKLPSDPAWQPFFERGILPDLEPVAFIGRAITPPRRPKRFDTRFFAVDHEAIQDEVTGVISPDSELVELVWVEIAAARDLELPSITFVMLDELEHRIEAGFGAELPAPFYYERHGRFVRDAL